MRLRDIKIPRGYEPKTQAKVGLFAAQLDDQLRLLKASVKELTVEQLEWQQRPGMNSIGMLLAHRALVEAWWLLVAPKCIPWEPDGQKLLKKACGFDDDGLPLPPKGKHPEYLRGYTVEQYLTGLAKVRRSAHRELRSWRDSDLEKSYELRKMLITRRWTLYHVLEHFAGHFGQILIMKHMLKDAGKM